MNPYYFGSSEKPLFGIYHPPRGQQYKDVGVVLCYPFGHEYIRSHRAFQQLANMLSRAGFNVFRFDYYGTGDSSGNSDEGNIAQWEIDIRAAISELKDVSGVRKVSLVGLRLGATLAYAATADRNDIDDLVLWDPVVSGKHYVDSLQKMHRTMLADLERFSLPRYEDKEQSDELLGFPFMTEMKETIAGINLLETVNNKAKNIHLIVSEEKDEYRQLLNRFQKGGTAVNFQETRESCQWDNIGKIEIMLLPYTVLQTIVAILSKVAT